MKHTLLTGIVFVFTVSSFAQRQLTYEEAVTIALQKNVDFNVQHNEVDRAGYMKAQSISQLTPSLRVEADAFNRRGRQQIQNPETNQVEFLDVISDNLNMSINASMPVFNGMNRINRYRASQSNLEAQEFGLERTKQNTIFNVAQQYLQVLLSEELYRIAEDNHRNQSENLKRIEGLVEVGSLAVVDKYNQLAEVKRLELLTIRARNTFENDKLVLAQTLQLEPGTDFVLTKPKFSIEETLQLQINIDDLYQTALANRPDYNQQKSVVLSNSRLVSSLRGSYLPGISAFYIYGSSYNSQIPYSQSDQLTTVNPYHFYGFSFTVPIFAGLATRTQVQSAKIDRENSLLQENNLKTIIYRDVKTAYQNFQDMKAGYVSSMAQFDAANAAYNLEKERYELGLSAFFEFSTANNNLIQAQAARAQSGYMLMFQETILNYQIGLLKQE